MLVSPSTSSYSHQHLHTRQLHPSSIAHILWSLCCSLPPLCFYSTHTDNSLHTPRLSPLLFQEHFVLISTLVRWGRSTTWRVWTRVTTARLARVVTTATRWDSTHPLGSATLATTASALQCTPLQTRLVMLTSALKVCSAGVGWGGGGVIHHSVQSWELSEIHWFSKNEVPWSTHIFCFKYSPVTYIFFWGGGGGDMPLDPLVLEVFPLDSSHTWMWFITMHRHVSANKSQMFYVGMGGWKCTFDVML